MEDPKLIFDSLMNSCRKAKLFVIKCEIDDDYAPNGVAPFDYKMKQGFASCKIIASSLEEAKEKVLNYLPVVRFLDEGVG